MTSDARQVENMSKGRQQHEFFCNDLVVKGDIRVTFYDHDEVETRDEKMFFFWFHTGTRPTCLVSRSRVCSLRLEWQGLSKTTTCR